MMVKNSKIGSNCAQYLFETSTWIRLIDFLHQETAYLKTRLSEVLDEIDDKEHLALAEHFQNQFIIKDDVYDHMKHDLKKHIENWQQYIYTENTPLNQSLLKIHTRLKEQIDYIERDHSILRKDYNAYLINLVKYPTLN